jgi:hypothetical protein
MAHQSISLARDHTENVIGIANQMRRGSKETAGFKERVLFDRRTLGLASTILLYPNISFYMKEPYRYTRLATTTSRLAALRLTTTSGIMPQPFVPILKH